MIKLNFNDLEIFITVCEEASINKAAIKLRYAQSNISQRISKLENELGVVLLFRNQKSAKATKAGEEFLAYSKKVL
ncbi:TPA: LysR family transcriptional regulator, partial [Staphylococcus aureus]|nr:LysR family transcriptional regulator [Staphylococcus aureus]